jgi:signal transduction histidine kinase/DNA-binding response OmpR family regulator
MELAGKRILIEILKITKSPYGFIYNDKMLISENLDFEVDDLIRDIQRNKKVVIYDNYNEIITSFMGIPLLFNEEILGIIGLINGEYNDNINNIKPFLTACISIMHNKQEQEKVISETQNNFLAIMSHEIRTPLNGIIGMCEILSDTEPMTIEQKEYLEIINNCGKNLKELIDNILDFSKLRENKVVLNKKKVDIRNLLEEISDIFVVELKSKKLDLYINVATEIPQVILIDPERLGQIIKNLISNAIKFTYDGRIIINVSINDDNKLLFSVSDTGIGIPSNKINTIFETFTQINSSYTRNASGVGLGLAICKKIVELMDGKIWVESTINEGSTFYFTIKVKKLKRIDKKDISILIVDDNALNRQIIFKHLHSFNLKPMMCSSGEETLLLLDSGFSFDIIFVDICMPNMSGIELAQKIKEKYPKIKLIALSSIGELSKEESINFYDKLTKPIKRKKLKQVIIKSATKEGNHSKNTKKPKRILIVEDDNYNQIVCKKLLNKLGYINIDTANNGTIALDMINKNQYDIILLDVIMPETDGYSVIKKLDKRIIDNIIILTAIVTTEDKEKFINLGVKGYLTKPIDIKKLNLLLK